MLRLSHFRTAATLIAIFFFFPSLAHALPTFFYQVDISALDAVTGLPIDQDSISGSWERPVTPAVTDSVTLDVPGNTKYFARITGAGFGGPSDRLRLDTICSTPASCAGEVAPPDLLSVSLSAFAEKAWVGTAASQLTMEYTNLSISLTSLDSGNSIPLFSGTGFDSVPIATLEALAGKNCANLPEPDRCLYRVDLTNLADTSNASFSMRITPEPSTALLVGLGTGILALRQRSR